MIDLWNSFTGWMATDNRWAAIGGVVIVLTLLLNFFNSRINKRKFSIDMQEKKPKFDVRLEPNHSNRKDPLKLLITNTSNTPAKMLKIHIDYSEKDKIKSIHEESDYNKDLFIKCKEYFSKKNFINPPRELKYTITAIDPFSRVRVYAPSFKVTLKYNYTDKSIFTRWKRDLEEVFEIDVRDYYKTYQNK